MKKMMATALAWLFLSSMLSSSAQTQSQHQSQAASQKLEAMLNTAEIPFNKTEDGSYIAVVSVSQNESERFHIQLNYLGDDPNNQRYQVIQMYFLLGQIPKGAAFPPALIKQINQWNADLTMGRVVAVGNVIMYTSSAWLAKSDAESLTLDAALGHFASQDLRKEIAPYLKS